MFACYFMMLNDIESYPQPHSEWLLEDASE